MVQRAQQALEAGNYEDSLTALGELATPDAAQVRTHVQFLQRMLSEVTFDPGAKASAVDRAARRVIEKAGYGPQFTHALGHGIGLDVHEAPRVGKETHALLKPGMVITIEPGIYVPGKGGVRLEDDVLVTETGHEVLSTLPC